MSSRRERGLAACKCGAEWGGYRTSHCSGCHLTFTSIGAFDKHRPGACVPPANVGLVVVRSSGNQQVWGFDGSSYWGSSPRAEPVAPVQLATDLLDQISVLKRLQEGMP